MKPEGRTRLVVMPHHGQLRLDQYVAAASELSRRQARKLIGAGLVWRNSQPSRVLSRQVVLGDVIDVLRPPAELGCPGQPTLAAVNLLFEDSWLAAADKAAGVLSQPAEHGQAGELALDQQLLLSLAARDGKRPYLRLIHRIDRLTSGVLLFACKREATKPLALAWAENRVRRSYLALVAGQPAEEFDLEQAIARDPGHPWRFQVAARGKPAHTRVRTLARFEDRALVVCQLLSGRTHQVRVHLAAAGHPVLGDHLYGAPRSSPEPQRPLLHAASIALPHPRTGAALEIRSGLPSDIRTQLPAQLDLTGLW